MKKGELSKNSLTKAILDLYPNNAFTDGKLIYVNFKEGGEDVQLKITLTQCANPVSPALKQEDPQTQITQEEQETLSALLERLGL